MKEEWKEISGYGGHYEASTLGRIRSKHRTVTKRHSSGKIMKQVYKQRVLNPHTGAGGYLLARIGVDKKNTTVQVGRLVLLAFQGQPEPDQVCRHLDGSPSNNMPSNLAWGTHTENMQDRKLHGNYAAGYAHPMAKYQMTLIEKIRQAPDGATCSELSRLYGVSRSHISRIRRGVCRQES